MKRLGFVLTLGGLVQASCVTPQAQVPSAGEISTANGELGADSERDRAANSSARPTQALLAQAHAAWQSGGHDQALALLNRAYRIDPLSAEVLLRHAEYYFELGQFKQAEAWSRRALSSAQPSHGQTRRAWLLVARSRARLGDQSGAARAWSQVPPEEKQP